MPARFLYGHYAISFQQAGDIAVLSMYAILNHQSLGCQVHRSPRLYMNEQGSLVLTLSGDEGSQAQHCMKFRLRFIAGGFHEYVQSR